VTAESLATLLPTKERIAQGAKVLEARMRLPDAERATALETLKRALDAEVETSGFYQQMVATLPAGAPRDMFGRFLEIEQGHQAIVAAELDAVQGLGFWFDLKEFDLEAG
jgi:rubrerythrin